MFDIGDGVWWLSIVGSSRIERAGYIVNVVPAGKLPGEYVPPDLVAKFYGTTIRTHNSYIIRVPGVGYAFWPQVASLHPLTEDKEYILEKQPKSRKRYFIRKDLIDTSDRKELLFLIQKMFGVSCKETPAFIEVPDWGKRFWFKVTGGEECICHVDVW